MLYIRAPKHFEPPKKHPKKTKSAQFFCWAGPYKLNQPKHNNTYTSRRRGSKRVSRAYRHKNPNHVAHVERKWIESDFGMVVDQVSRRGIMKNSNGACRLGSKWMLSQRWTCPSWSRYWKAETKCTWCKDQVRKRVASRANKCRPGLKAFLGLSNFFVKNSQFLSPSWINYNLISTLITLINFTNF